MFVYLKSEKKLDLCTQKRTVELKKNWSATQNHARLIMTLLLRTPTAPVEKFWSAQGGEGVYDIDWDQGHGTGTWDRDLDRVNYQAIPRVAILFNMKTQ